MNTPKPLPQATLADYTKPELIIPQLAARTTAAVMQELVDRLHHQDTSVPHPNLLSSCLSALNRELLTSRMLDLGATFPQAHLASLSRPCFAFGRASEPLPWLAPALRPIDLVFLMLDPQRPDVESRQLANTLQGLGKNCLRLDDLRRAATAEEMFALLAQISLVAASDLPPLPMTAAPLYHTGRSAFGSRRWRC